MSSGQQASSAVLCCSEEPRVFPPSAAADTKWRSTALSERGWHCHVKIVPGAKIVPAYVIVCLHPDNLPGNRRRDAENMFPNDEIT